MSTSQIPSVLLLQIFDYLTFADLRSCLRVSKGWNIISKNDQLWQRFLVNDLTQHEHRPKRKKIDEQTAFQKVTLMCKRFSQNEFKRIGSENWKTVKQIKFHKEFIFVSFEDNTVRILNGANKCEKTICECTPMTCFESEKNLLFYGSIPGISIWDYTQLHKLRNPQTTVSAICMKFSNERLFFGTRNLELGMMTCNNTELRRERSFILSSPFKSEGIERLDVAPEGSTLFCIRSQIDAVILDIRVQKYLHAIPGDFDSIQYQEPFIFCGLKSGVLRQWDIRTFSEVRTFGEKIIDSQVDGNFVFTAHETGSIQLWDLSRGEVMAQRKTSPHINSLRHQKGKLIYGEKTGFLNVLNYSE